MPIICQEVVSAAEAGLRLDKWFHHKGLGIPFQQVQRLCRTGQLRVNGKRAKSNHLVQANDAIRFPIFEPLPSTEASRPDPETLTGPEHKAVALLVKNILRQTRDLIIFNKPGGLAVQGGTGIHLHVDGLLPHIAAALDLPPTLHLAHRLDRDTSGLLMVATSSLAARDVTEAFRAHHIHKTYLALCQGTPKYDHGILRQRLKETRHGHEKIMVAAEEGKEAVTNYKIIDAASSVASLLELTPQTGRTHQLRVACQTLECPVMGDPKYGNPDHPHQGPMFLHAWRLHWPERGLDIEAPLPEAFSTKLKDFGLKV